MLGDVLEDKDALQPDEVVILAGMQLDVDSVLHTLTKREHGILRMRYGLDDGQPRTLEEIGVAFHVSPQMHIPYLDTVALPLLPAVQCGLASESQTTRVELGRFASDGMMPPHSKPHLLRNVTECNHYPRLARRIALSYLRNAGDA